MSRNPCPPTPPLQTQTVPQLEGALAYLSKLGSDACDSKALEVRPLIWPPG